jgi:predicted transcriptional regulator of viral defense system
MKYHSLVDFVGGMACFDLPLLVQGFEGQREAIRVQLSRWMRVGRVIGLRRGMYTLPDAYRRAPLSPAALANQLYRPSYLSGLWALGFYDLIPERVVWLTSVTPRVPRRFENLFGVFDYRNLKQDAFFGYLTVEYGGAEVVVAEPEKALLDHWHLTPGEWTEARLAEMRYQHMDRIAEEKLHAYAERFRSPRLRRAVGRWLALAADAEKGTVSV